MSRADLAEQTCSIARAIAHVGDEWSLMILRELFLGSRRFDDFQRFTGMSTHLLSKRLRKLEQQNVIVRRPYSYRPVRNEYHLTKMGRDLWPVIIALKQWGDRWLVEDPIPVQVQHQVCGQISKANMVCSECGEPFQAVDAVAVLSQSYADERKLTAKSVVNQTRYGE